MFRVCIFSAVLGLCGSSGTGPPLWPRQYMNGHKTSRTAIPGPRACVPPLPCAPPELTYALTLPPAGSPDDVAYVAPLLGGANGSTLLCASSTGTVWALEASTGAALWSYEMVASSIAGFSLSADGGALFVGDSAGYAAALDVRDGRPLWVADLGNMSFTAPVANGALVFFATTPNGALLALRAASGAEVWRAPLGPVIIGAPSFGSAAGGACGEDAAAGCDTLFVVTNAEATRAGFVVLALDAASGARRWAAPLDAAADNLPAGELTVGGGRLFWCGLLGLTAANASTGARLWTSAPNGVPGNSQCTTTPALSARADIVYTSVFVSGVYALRASDGAVVWYFPGATSDAATVLDGAGGLYYADYEGQVVALDAASGRLWWRFNTNLSVPSDLALGWGMLALATGPQTLFVLGLPPPPPPPPPPPSPALPAPAMPAPAAAALGALSALALLALCLVLTRCARLAPRTVVPLAKLRDRGRSIATSTEFDEAFDTPLLLPPPPPLPPSEGSGGPGTAAVSSAAPSPLHDSTSSSRWANTASRLPTDFDFVDEERLFQERPTATPIAAGAELRLLEGDSWVLQGASPPHPHRAPTHSKSVN